MCERGCVRKETSMTSNSRVIVAEKRSVWRAAGGGREEKMGFSSEGKKICVKYVKYRMCELNVRVTR